MQTGCPFVREVRKVTGLLVLTRKEGQAVWLDLPNGERIEVVFCEDKGPKTARLGFRAPKSVKIWRPEVLGTHDASGKPIEATTEAR